MQYVPRRCNAVVDKSAKIAQREGSNLWINEAPTYIIDVLALDSLV